MVHVSASPPLIPDGRISRVRLAAKDGFLSHHPACPSTRRLKRSRTYPPHVHGVREGEPWAPLTPLLQVLHVPARCRPLRPSSYREPLRLSTSMTRSLSLLRAHAPDLTPLLRSFDARRGSLRRLLRAPAGVSPFPTCSRRILPCVLGPLPRWLLRCIDPCLPSRHRPSPREDQVGAPQSPCSDFSTAPLSRLQSFRDVQARRCAHHPGRSYRYGHVRMAAVVSPSEHLVVCSLPTPRICLPSESGN